MSRGTWVYRDGEMVEKRIAMAEDYLSKPLRRSSLPSPYLALDTIDAFRSMADGKMYDSKASYRAELKRQGIREIGNDVPAHLKDLTDSAPQKPKAKADLIKAYHKVKQGYKPVPAPRIAELDD